MSVNVVEEEAIINNLTLYHICPEYTSGYESYMICDELTSDELDIVADICNSYSVQIERDRRGHRKMTKFEDYVLTRIKEALSNHNILFTTISREFLY